MTPTERGDWLPDPDELECGYRTSVGYIIGGETAKRGEFPFTALIGYGGLRVSVIKDKLCTGFSNEIGTKLRDWAVGQTGGSCYSRAALSSNDSKTL